MYNVCLRYHSDADLAKEAMQRGFIKVFSNLHKYKSIGNLGGWIRTIVVRTAIDLIKERKKLQFEDIDSVADVHNDWNESEETSSHIDNQSLLGLLSELPIGYKTVFTMYVIDEIKHQEIATLLNISISTSRSQLHKARKMLQSMIQKNYGNIYHNP